MTWVLGVIATIKELPSKWQHFSLGSILVLVMGGLATQVTALDNKLTASEEKRLLLESSLQTIKSDVGSIQGNIHRIEQLQKQKEDNDRERYENTTRQIDQIQRLLLRNRND